MHSNRKSAIANRRYSVWRAHSDPVPGIAAFRRLHLVSGPGVRLADASLQGGVRVRSRSKSKSRKLASFHTVLTLTLTLKSRELTNML